MKYFYYIIIITLSLNSCVPTKKICKKRIRKYVKNYPSLMKKDTVVVVDTFELITKEVKFDTIIQHDVDSVEVVKEKLRIKYIKKDNIVYLSGECEADTIYKIVNKEIEVPVIDVEKESLSDSLGDVFWVLIIFGTLYLLINLFKKNL